MKIFYSEKTGEYVIAGNIKDAEAFLEAFGTTVAGTKTFKFRTDAWMFLHKLWTGLDDVHINTDAGSYSLRHDVEVIRV